MIHLASINILGDGEDGIGKLIVGVVAVLIWGISSLASYSAKKKEQERRQRLARELSGNAPQPQQRAPQAPTLRQKQQAGMPARRHPENAKSQRLVRTNPTAQRAQLAPQQPLRSIIAPPPQQRRPAPARRPTVVPIPGLNAPFPPPLPRAAAPQASSAYSSPIEATEISSQRAAASAAAARRGTGATAASLRGWLRPGTLRQQFILTEVFQPPIALREPRI